MDRFEGKGTMNTQTEKHYTDEEFCQMYGIDRRTSHRWREKRLIGFIRTPTGKIRYLQRHVDAFEKRNEKRAAA